MTIVEEQTVIDQLRIKLIAQAKKCQTANGAAMLCLVNAYLFQDYKGMDGCDELYQVADHLCGEKP